MKPNHTFLLLAAILTVLAAATPVAAEVQVTFVKGAVFRGPTQTGPWHLLSLGESITPPGFVRTADDGIIELTLPDASMIRLAPNSMYEIQEAVFEAPQPRRFSAKLFLGKLWANVHKYSGGLIGRFENRIPTAVVGVRGTVYHLVSGADRSADVYVYEGRVGVGPPVLAPGAPREEISWPAEVSEQQWEEIILGKLQRLRIGADGRPGKPQAFDPQAVRDPWVAFNQDRDARKP